MIPVCSHCSGQVIGGTCLQCSREVNPFAPDTDPAYTPRIVQGAERHTRPLPLAETRTPWTMAANPRKVRR